MAHPSLIIIGGGPAGLMAARTAARAGLGVLLFEALPRAGDLGHPCSGVIAPAPGFVRGERTPAGIRFPALDLTIPAALIVGTPSVQRYVGPGGGAFEARFPSRADFPIAALDKPALLRLLAEQATAAGAELRFGTPVTGLLKEDGRVVGVRSRNGEFRSPLVLSAEGVSRRFTEEAGLYEGMAAPKRYAFIVSETLDAPAASHPLQISTLGRRYTSANTPVFGSVVVPAPGRAEVYFSVFAETPQAQTDESLWRYLAEYKANDPRVSGLLAGSRPLARSGTRMVLRPVPPRVTADGFIGLGDSVGPGGHVGIVPCLYLGQQAARVAAQAFRAGDTSRNALAAYDRLYHGPFQRGLDTEYKIITGLANMRDDQLDRLCETLSKINLAPFFFGRWQPMAVETWKWIVTGFPLILRDWRLIQRMMGGEVE